MLDTNISRRQLFVRGCAMIGVSLIALDPLIKKSLALDGSPKVLAFLKFSSLLTGFDLSDKALGTVYLTLLQAKYNNEVVASATLGVPTETGAARKYFDRLNSKPRFADLLRDTTQLWYVGTTPKLLVTEKHAAKSYTSGNL